MKTFTLCFFTLLVLGVVQAKGDFAKENTKTHKAVNGVVTYLQGLITQRKANIIKRFSDQASVLQSTKDVCALKRASKIETLSEQLNDLHSCTIVDDLVDQLSNIVATVVSIIGEVLNTLVAVILGVVNCLLTTPLSLDCLLAQVALLLKAILDVVVTVIYAIVYIIVGILTLLADLLKCLNLQQVFEDKFEVIMSTACHEI